ncbi:DGQHR domain-containing protein [Acinetobacter baumannii]
MAEPLDKIQPILLPALRGIMGDWVYYTCLMSLDEISKRINFAKEIHKNEQLSDMIQRSLTDSRSKAVAEYLKDQEERFFNSIVVATYGGEPSWLPLSNIQNHTQHADTIHLSEETIASVGFLALNGEENLFALDGQHRLAGIKKAVKSKMIDDDPYDEVSVIFVSHHVSSKGLERTRRLFTTLNKTARPVKKGDIIALDEDDVMSITVRWLIEESGFFPEERVAFVATNNMPSTNTKSLTTIGSLYDVMTIIFTSFNTKLKKKKSDLQKVRPSDEELNKYFELAKTFFSLLKTYFPEIKEFFDSSNYSTVVAKYRNSNGGNILFRPIGLQLIVKIIAILTESHNLEESVKLASLLPRDLTEEPFIHLMWDNRKKTMINDNKTVLRNILLYMLKNNIDLEKTTQQYRTLTNNQLASLPAVVI